MTQPAATFAAQPVANARMYSATPQARADWKTLLAWALRHAGLDWPGIDTTRRHR